ncbi:MAG: AraC family transcriptional regulator [Pseudomonadota bacterium]
MFLFATAVDVSGWFLTEDLAIPARIEDYKPVLVMLQMPAFAGFVWLNCFQRKAFKPYDALHAIPAIVVIGFVATDTPIPQLRLFFEIQYALYIAAAIYALWRVQRQIKSQSPWRSPSWLWLTALVVTSLGAHSLFVFRTVFSTQLPDGLKSALEVSAAALILIVMVSIALEALLNPRVFRGLDRIMAFAANEIGQPTSQGTRRLDALMEERRPYLDPDLTLARLARQSGMTTKDLSVQINQRHGVHFFDFVNRYRVEHAMALLGETDQSVTEVYLGSGFNTKSSFNTAFRKHSGMTPSAYRKETRNT